MLSFSNYCKGKIRPGSRPHCREWNHLRICSDAIHQSGARKKLPVYAFVYWWVVVVVELDNLCGQVGGRSSWLFRLATMWLTDHCRIPWGILLYLDWSSLDYSVLFIRRPFHPSSFSSVVSLFTVSMRNWVVNILIVQIHLFLLVNE